MIERLRHGTGWMASSGGDKDGMQVCRDLREFLIGSRRTTQDLLRRFKGQTESPVVFKQILHELADMDEENEGAWRLKREFR